MSHPTPVDPSLSGAMSWTLASLLSALIVAAPAFAADAVLSWDPNTEPDLAGYSVHYGTSSGAYSITVPVGLVTTYTVTGLGPGTYYFAVTAANTSGAASGYSNEVSKTIADTTPPTISAVVASGVTATGATLTWTTNEPASSAAEYGTTTSYGASTAVDATLVTTHARSLSGLTPSTTYHFRVMSLDATGNVAVSADYTLTTAAAPDTTPPAIGNMVAGSITSSGATVTWTTNEAASTQVEYGLTTTYGASTTLNATLATAHSAALTGLQAATLYHYRVRSSDAAGNAAVSGDATFTTAAAPDTVPPVISGTTASTISATSAVITWSTNEASTSVVEYGMTTAYGSSSSNATLVTTHSMTLTGLIASTAYHYRVRSSDAAGNAAVSGDATFTTAAALDTTAPTLTSISAGSITSTGTTVTWMTNEAASTQVEYGLTTTYGASTTLNATLVTAHSAALTGLQAATLYHYRVRSSDAAGNAAVSGDATFTTAAAPDTVPPVISGTTASTISATSAVITWSTNEASTSVVEYGMTTAYGSSSSNATLVTTHSMTLTGLIASTAYHYRVRSSDAAGNAAVSGDATFRTAQAPDTTGPSILNLSSTDVTPSTAVVTWSTNEAATSQVEYGLTTAYGQRTTANATLVTSHRETLSSLTPGTTYHVRVLSADAAGNLSTSGDLAVLVPVVPDTTPPQDISAFSSVGAAGQVTLTWTNPPDADFMGVQIRFRTDRYPSGPTDGELLGDFTGQPGEQGQAVHQNLINGLTYYYAAASYDQSGNRQSTVYTSSTPLSQGSAVDQPTPTGGCGMIIPSGGDPPGPWQAADLLILAGVALYLMMRRRLGPGYRTATL